MFDKLKIEYKHTCYILECKHYKVTLLCNTCYVTPVIE